MKIDDTDDSATESGKDATRDFSHNEKQKRRKRTFTEKLWAGLNSSADAVSTIRNEYRVDYS